MLKYIYITLLGLLGIMAFSLYILYNSNKELERELDVAVNNQKAFIAENTILKDENKVFKFTIEQLNYYNDSLLEKINNVRKELNIKDDELKQMQYLLSIAEKKDTIVFTDTIFLDKNLDLDTLIGDNWYSIKLGLKYPNVITTNPIFTSEKYIITKSTKETINPPKKCALLRLFQKKHRVLEVIIEEKNPYILNTQQRFIEIID